MESLFNVRFSIALASGYLPTYLPLMAIEYVTWTVDDVDMVVWKKEGREAHVSVWMILISTYLSLRLSIYLSIYLSICNHRSRQGYATISISLPPSTCKAQSKSTYHHEFSQI